MLNAFQIGATGMQAQQQHLDAIANNLANANTPAFKKGRIHFGELVQRAAAPALSALPALPGQAGAAEPMAAGIGVAARASQRSFEAGELRRTDGPMDIALQGDGFLELTLADGSRAYTRGGTLKVNADGQLATQEGLPLKPGVRIPAEAQAVLIGRDGRVQVRLEGASTPQEVGQLELVRFANPQGLAAQADNLYRATEASGEPIAGRPGEDGMASLAQGLLEGSNVKLVEEMVNLMVAQRAYEASVRVVQAADDVMGLINGLRR